MKRIGGKKPLRWFVREWREFRRLTLDQVAGRLDTNKGVVSKLETGQSRMNEDWMAGLAEAFNCSPGDLLRDPLAPTRDDLLNGLQPADQQRVIHFAEGLKKTG